MGQHIPYYLQVLKDELSRRQGRSPDYSMRAFCRDMGISPTTLSLMFQGKRPLPLNISEQVAERLKLNPEQKERFLASLTSK